MVIESLTYKDAGVDDNMVSSILTNCIPYIKKTHNNLVGKSGTGKEGGGFFAKYDDLLTSMDGVGTKSIFTLKYSNNIENAMINLGIDLFYAVYNDILVGGCLEPMFFLDYYGSSNKNMEQLEPFIKSLSSVCQKHKCSLIGGETATMTDMYKDNINLIGMIVGKSQPNFNWSSGIYEGDFIYGLPSSGTHANGYTLIRKICNENLDIPYIVLNQLLSPTCDYSKCVNEIQAKYSISGMVHITGGGFNNILRILPDNLNAHIDCNSWTRLECFDWLQSTGNITSSEMYNVFNMGIGYIIISPDDIKIKNVFKIGKIELNNNNNKKVILDY